LCEGKLEDLLAADKPYAANMLSKFHEGLGQLLLGNSREIESNSPLNGRIPYNVFTFFFYKHHLRTRKFGLYTTSRVVSNGVGPKLRWRTVQQTQQETSRDGLSIFPPQVMAEAMIPWIEALH